FYFNVDGIEKTVSIDREKFVVKDGKAVEKPDCWCKTSRRLIEKIWYDNYKPSMSDFISGKIRSNDPYLLRRFMEALGRKV
ncbi:MAG: hypothetical protein SVN78_07460, partial [Deferribacterota bacterium]|nr:hypothetical protein [Deferribacterota bacterium]